jgi:hypothetical protein
MTATADRTIAVPRQSGAPRDPGGEHERTARTPTETPGAPSSDSRPCHCGHLRSAHVHFRPGTDCGSCRCSGYAGARTVLPWVQLAAALRRAVRPRSDSATVPPWTMPTAEWRR